MPTKTKAKAKPKLLEKLPHVPSKLIRLAIRDIKRAKKCRWMAIYMGTYHRKEEGKCYVCFAGAVMHFGLKPPNGWKEANGHEITPGDYDEHNANALHALDCFRKGDAPEGCSLLNVKTSLKYDYVDSYEMPLNAFIERMEKLAADFKAEGN